ncbi:hypothetical protein [Amycolatopsis keratiniphila]|uniref:hypothetical protein n=1 Tax=Amycolatopsis keratiniphila TaxID=129921 RepID=UPI0003A0010C|nr:hypothetical protein [Amycolatopsis keratiniphila]
MSTPTDVKDPIGEEEPVDPAQPKPDQGEHRHGPDCEHQNERVRDCPGGCAQTPPPTP